MCLVPRIPAMGKWSPDTILLKWLDARKLIGTSQCDEDFLFVTTTGQRKGSQVSTDSLRKHIVAAFGHSVATRSLRKGGATFYDRQGVLEEATKQQGGWRTTEVMKSIYTKMSAAEVANEIHTVAARASIQLELQRRTQNLGASREDVLEQDPTVLLAFISFVQTHFKSVDLITLRDTAAARYVNWISQHTLPQVREPAVTLHTYIREHWAACQRAKRPRVQV